MDCNSPWLVNLVATAKDDKNIFMLLEAVMGGELFAYLQVNYGLWVWCRLHVPGSCSLPLLALVLTPYEKERCDTDTYTRMCPASRPLLPTTTPS